MAADNSFILKLDRAREHLHSFDRESQAWIETEPYGIVDEPDPEPPPQSVPNGYQPRRFRITRVSTVPKRLSIILGDCVFNLRSALDHLALALAKAFTPVMSSAHIGSSEFPVFERGPLNPREEARKIGCIDPAARTIIEALQPYHKGNRYAADPLWQVHELNRIDKHRTLTVCAAEAMKSGHGAVGIPVDEITNLAGYSYFICSGRFELKQDAVFTRWSALPIDSSREVCMNPALPIEIVFGDAGPFSMKPVVPLLVAACDFIQDSVIAPLSKYL